MGSSSLTCYLTQGDVDKLKSLLRGKAADEDIKEALQRLDRLTQDELRNVAAQTLGVVSGKKTHSACPTSTEYPSLDVQASVDSVREDTSTSCRRRRQAIKQGLTKPPENLPKMANDVNGLKRPSSPFRSTAWKC